MFRKDEKKLKLEIWMFRISILMFWTSEFLLRARENFNSVFDYIKIQIPKDSEFELS